MVFRMQPCYLIRFTSYLLHKESILCFRWLLLDNGKTSCDTYWSQHHLDWYVIIDLLQKLPSLKETFDFFWQMYSHMCVVCTTILVVVHNYFVTELKNMLNCLWTTGYCGKFATLFRVSFSIAYYTKNTVIVKVHVHNKCRAVKHGIKNDIRTIWTRNIGVIEQENLHHSSVKFTITIVAVVDHRQTAAVVQ